MSKDITAILDGWDYDPDELQVRIVAGDDGRDKLQMRIDLGLIQMELSGRPDGSRPRRVRVAAGRPRGPGRAAAESRRGVRARLATRARP